MQRSEDGWHVVDANANIGARYQFVLAGGKAVGDPASRLQLDDLDGPSLIVDPDSYTWRHAEWSGRPWEETVVYEIHIGALTRRGPFGPRWQCCRC
jgi:maltooligosyltrehalose trehalohydrolase